MDSLVNQQRIVNRFLSVTQIWAPSGKEKAVADKVVHDYKAMNIPGMKITVDDSAPRTGSDSGNVIVDIPATPDAPKDAKAIGLFFHMDQVPARAAGVPADEPVKVVLDADGFHSQGWRTNIGADDRCGLSEIEEAVQAIEENHIAHGPIRVIGFTREETGLDGARELDPKYLKGLDYGFEIDAENIGEIMRGGASIYHWEANLKGLSAHAGVHPEQGKSAIEAAAFAINHMGKLGKVSETQTLNVSNISGGILGEDGNPVTNAIPDRAFVAGEFRGVTPQELESLQKTVAGSFEAAAKATGVTYTLNFGKMDGFYLDDNAPAVKFAVQAMQTAGVAPEKTSSMGGIDGNYINSKGLPTVGIGDGGHNEHTVKEYTTWGELVKGTAVVMTLIAQTAKPAQSFTTSKP